MSEGLTGVRRVAKARKGEKFTAYALKLHPFEGDVNGVVEVGYEFLRR